MALKKNKGNRRMMMKDIKKDPFDEYIRNLPPTRKELGQAWSTAKF